jgi:hypothetical protein
MAELALVYRAHASSPVSYSPWYFCTIPEGCALRYGKLIAPPRESRKSPRESDGAASVMRSQAGREYTLVTVAVGVRCRNFVSTPSAAIGGEFAGDGV